MSPGKRRGAPIALTPSTDTNILSGSQTLSPGHFAGLHVYGGLVKIVP